MAAQKRVLAPLLLVLFMVGGMFVLLYKTHESPAESKARCIGTDPFLSDPDHNIYRVRNRVRTVLIEKAISAQAPGASRYPVAELHYDQNGCVLQKIDFDGLGAKSPPTNFTYDNEGRLAETVSHRADGSVWFKTTFSHDSNGRLIEEVKRDNESGAILSRRTYSYIDEKKSVVRTEYGGENNQRSQVEFVIDDRGMVTGANVLLGELEGKRSFSYDKNGNLNKVVLYAANDEPVLTQQYSYVYDTNGNWITRTSEASPADLSSDEVIHRVISYQD